MEYILRLTDMSDLTKKRYLTCSSEETNLILSNQLPILLTKLSKCYGANNYIMKKFIYRRIAYFK